MRFLRMLTNSVLAGAFGAAYLTVLMLQLNPQMPVFSASTWRWFYTLAMLYGVHLAVLFYVAIVFREFFTIGSLSPGWVSVRLLAWMGAVAAGVAAFLMWSNLRGFALTLDEVAVRRMTAGAAATTAAAVVLFGIAVAHFSFGRRGSRVGAALFVLAAFGSLALPIAARGGATLPAPRLAAEPPAAAAATEDAPDPAQPRVVLLMLDGASLDYVWPRVAEGRLPNFAKLLESGAVMDLATIRPTQPDPVWATVATGVYPSKNGVRSAAAYYARNDDRALDLLPARTLSHALVHLGFVRDEPKTSDAWRARPIWRILSTAGIRVGVVRWPLTHPAEPLNGFLVSDRFDQHIGSIVEFERAVHPAAVLPALMDGVASSQVPAEGDPASPEASAMRRDRLYSAAMRELRQRMEPRFVALRYQGLDTVGHYYFRYTQPRGIRAVPEETQRRFVQIVDRYYTFIDAEIGAALQTLAPGDLLVVVSGFGMGARHPVKQLLGRLLNSPDHNGTHENAPDGFLLAFGTAVQPGRPPRAGSIVDVTPTLLYFLGLPVGRDMDGYARSDLFTRAFTAERPIDFIPSYSR